MILRSGTNKMLCNEVTRQIFAGNLRNNIETIWILRKQLRHTVSKLYQPKELIPRDKLETVKKNDESTSKSSRLMKEYGITKSVGNGYFALLPLATRAINKLTKLIDKELENVGCQKIYLPHTVGAELWAKSGRLQGMGPELIRYKDRHNKEMILCPTHEETITNIISSYELSIKELPLKLYQIGSKFRGEMRPKFGLIRANEFIMKDLYTFDKDLNSAMDTYYQICEAYKKIFDRLGVPYQRVEGDTGIMGGSLSHEYHYPAGIGEDLLLWCSECSKGRNIEVDENEESNQVCDSCSGKMEETKGIEVGHTFLLGQKYSKIFKANFLGLKGKPETLEMGCYGIGVSRVMAAATEVLSTETELRWPRIISPFSICIIPPKTGSKEYNTGVELMEQMYEQLNIHFQDDIIIDDRDKTTIGKKLIEADRTGYPIIIVIGKKSTLAEPLVEIQIPSAQDENQRKMEISPQHALQLLQSIKTDFS